MAVITELGNLLARERFAKRLPDIHASFRRHTGFGCQGVSGAVDGTHIAIKRPKGVRGKSYFSRNRKLTVVVQGVAASDLGFLRVILGHAGAVHDSVVFKTSQLGKDITAGTHPICLQAPYVGEGHAPVHLFLLGDKGYKVQRHLITPYSAAAEQQDPANSLFNYRLSSMRMCVERAFWELKASWRLLCGANRVLVCHEDRVNDFTLAAILLHNSIKVMRQHIGEDVHWERAREIERKRAAREARQHQQTPAADEEPVQSGVDRTRALDQVRDLWIADPAAMDAGGGGAGGGNVRRTPGVGGDARGRGRRRNVRQRNG